MPNRWQNVATTLASYEDDHEPSGNITRMDDLVSAGFNRQFGYDDLHRVTTTVSGSMECRGYRAEVSRLRRRINQTNNRTNCCTRQLTSYPLERYSYFGANLGFPFGGRNSNTFARCVWQRCMPVHYSDEWDRVIGNAGQLAPGWFQSCPK